MMRIYCASTTNEPDGVVNAIRMARESFEREERAPLSPDYLDRNVSMKVVKVIESYVQIVHRDTWYKS